MARTILHALYVVNSKLARVKHYSQFASQRPLDQIPDAESRGHEEQDEKQTQTCHQELEFSVAVLVSRCQGALGKIRWWCVGRHASSLSESL
jgi:hypothetical protein